MQSQPPHPIVDFNSDDTFCWESTINTLPTSFQEVQVHGLKSQGSKGQGYSNSARYMPTVLLRLYLHILLQPPRKSLWRREETRLGTAVTLLNLKFVTSKFYAGLIKKHNNHKTITFAILNSPLAARGFKLGEVNSFINEDAAALPSVHKIMRRSNPSGDTGDDACITRAAAWRLWILNQVE